MCSDHCPDVQPSLFYPAAPQGLTYFDNAISQEHSDQLVTAIDRMPWRTDLQRRVQHYGYLYDYRAGRAREEDFLGPLPQFLKELAVFMTMQGHFQITPDQVIVNEYLPGQGISAHVDCQPCFGETIASLSLLSMCVMQFSHQRDLETFELPLAPLSLLVMRGEARHRWQHAIPARKSDRIAGQRHFRVRRISLTFRTMRLS